MMELPTDLPEVLLPLAWTIGHWQGYGTLAAEFAPNQPEEAADTAPDAMILQNMQVEAVDAGLRVHVETFAAVADGEVPVTASAPEGVALLRAGELLWEETAIWTVASYRLGDKENPQPECIADLCITGGTAPGRWEARTLGPRISARLLTDEQQQATRMVGLVGGEFFWAQDRSLPGQRETAATEFTARLARVENNA